MKIRHVRHVREREKTSQSEYSGGPSSSMELIAIPSGLAGCKRKIEFDRCRWERKDGRKKRKEERRERGRPGVTGTTSLLGAYMSCSS